MIHVLVVEDDTEIQELFRLYFELEKIAVRFAGNGVDAIRLATEQRPDVVLLDIMLPDTSGLELAPALHAICGSDLPIIAVSASHRLHYDAEESGEFYTSLSKPLTNIHDILTVLTAATEGKE